MAVFAIMVGLILFYRGDRPSGDLSSVSQLAKPAPAAVEITPAAPESDEDAVPASPSTGTILRATPDKPSMLRKRPTRSASMPRLPRLALDERPNLELGTKPVVQIPAAAIAETERQTGSAIGADEIRRVVAQNEQRVKACYQGQTPAWLGASRKLEVQIKVAPSGEVADASVKNGVPHTPETQCIENRARSWKFRAPGGDLDQEVTVPFVIVSGTS